MKALLEMADEQVTLLAEICQRDGISRAEAIRRAIDYYGAHMLPPASLDEHFGRWKKRKINSLRYVDALRDEW